MAITIDKSSGSGNGTIKVTATPNPTMEDITSSLVVRTKGGVVRRVNIVQKGVDMAYKLNIMTPVLGMQHLADNKLWDAFEAPDFSWQWSCTGCSFADEGVRVPERAYVESDGTLSQYRVPLLWLSAFDYNPVDTNWPSTSGGVSEDMTLHLSFRINISSIEALYGLGSDNFKVGKWYPIYSWYAGTENDFIGICFKPERLTMNSCVGQVALCTTNEFNVDDPWYAQAWPDGCNVHEGVQLDAGGSADNVEVTLDIAETMDGKSFRLSLDSYDGTHDEVTDADLDIISWSIYEMLGDVSMGGNPFPCFTLWGGYGIRGGIRIDQLNFTLEDTRPDHEPR